MLAHAATSADETMSLVMLFAALWIGWAGWSRLKQRGFPRLPVVGAYALVGFAVVLVIAAAIVPRRIYGASGQPSPSPPASVRPASTASIAIDEPAPGTVVRGPTLDVVLSLPGGTIVDATSTNLTPDTGHVHLSIDGKLVSMTYGLVQELQTANLAPGRHTLTAEFVAADHGPFDPRVMASVTFTIAEPSP